ncbi:uncharacterized protein LOC110445819 [Mizuhopecten yessoensis]|uniref:uncharacterized protein LOC110445819 n=1 Tax=Mizuhopecten yessoensis TaxID=6573 RepID=UPI000B45AB0A|nr:uncharacterized protein LOC110445819 [Mizuhopecten yessoensis]
MPPVSELLLMNFAAHCHQQLKLRYSTIKLYLCGIRHFFLSSAVECPLYTQNSNFARLQLVMNGIKRMDGRPKLARYPVTFPVLHALCTRLRKGVFNIKLDRMMETACVVAFFGFLRCGEFTCMNSFDPTTNLCVSDITRADDHTILSLKTSKTDPFRKGVHIRLFCTSKSVCPKCILDKYISTRYREGATSTDALFVATNGQPLTRNVFIGMLRQVLSLCGFESHLFNGHSFRIGAATSAASKHIEDHLIKTMGRWSSDSYCRYIRTSKEVLHSAQKCLSDL